MFTLVNSVNGSLQYSCQHIGERTCLDSDFLWVVVLDLNSANSDLSLVISLTLPLSLSSKYFFSFVAVTSCFVTRSRAICSLARQLLNRST